MSNCAADAATRHLVSCNFITTVLSHEHGLPDIFKQALVAAIQRETFDIVCLKWRDLRAQKSHDSALSKLLLAIESNFDADVSKSPLIRQYLLFRDGYYHTVGGQVNAKR